MRTEEIQKRLDQLDDDEKNRKAEIESLSVNIKKLEAELVDPPKPPETREAIQQDSDRIGREELAITNEKGEIDEMMTGLGRQLHQAEQALNQSQQQFVAAHLQHLVRLSNNHNDSLVCAN